MRVRTAIAAAGASALLLWTASPAVGWGWLAWIGLVPAAAVALTATGRPGRLAVPLAYALYLELLFVPALPFGLADGQWGDPALPVLVGGSPVLPVALVLIPLLGVALYAIDLGRPWPRDRRPPAALMIVAPAVVWTGLEVLRVKLDPGAGWGPLYLTQAELPGGSLALLAGPWLITLAIVAVNYGLALALVRRSAAGLLAPAAAAIAILATAALEAEADSEAAPVVVAAVQPGYDTSEEERPQLRHFKRGSHDLAALDVIADLAAPTLRAAVSGAELVVWPEATMFVDPRSDRRVRRELVRLSRQSGAVLVVPYFLRYAGLRSEALAVIPDAEGRPRPAARLSDSRSKQRAMWFLGERGGGRPASEPLAAAGIELGLLPGLDGLDPALSAGLAEAGADLLVAPTHDWEALAVQQRAAARLAARSSGLPLVRADWRYGSAAYDRRGRVLADRGTTLRRTTLVGEIKPGPGGTPYARVGDLLAWSALAMGALALLWARRPTRFLADPSDG